MNVRSFLKLVEIQTKVASVTPFMLGTLYAVYRFNAFKLKNFLLMLVSLLCVDMATTAINNYMDYKRANRRHGFGYESHNAIPRYNLREANVVAIIALLLIAATVSGIVLFLNTCIVVLILGAISFAIGMLYSLGPVPISRTPFGEIYSGVFMGILIPFISAYIHVFDMNLLSISLQGGMLAININIAEVVYIILLCAPAAVGIANIMLANNICDIEDDIENRRYTLPVYIGKDASLKVFRALYYAGYIAFVVLLLMKAAPPVSAFAIGTFVVVEKNIKAFYKKQTKKDTFVLAVKNFVVVNAALVLTIAAAIILK